MHPWRLWLFGVGGVCIASLGILCNVAAIFVLFYYKSKSSAPFLLICLAVVDTVYLLVVMFLESITSICNYFIDRSYATFITPVYSVLYPVPMIAQTCSAYLVVVITMERFIVVSRPFLAHTLCNVKSARIAVVSVLIFSLLYNIPLYLAYDYDYLWINGSSNTNGSYKKLFHRTEFGQGYFFLKVFRIWMNLLFTFLTPFTFLLVFNGLMVFSLRRNRACSLGQTRVQHEHKLTVMVIVMTLVFFLCESFAATTVCLLAGFDQYRQLPEWVNRFSAVSDMMLMLNSAVNFAIYCATGRKFRETFRILFSSICFRWHCLKVCANKRKKNWSHSNESDSRNGVSLARYSATESSGLAVSFTVDKRISNDDEITLQQSILNIEGIERKEEDDEDDGDDEMTKKG